MIVSLTAGILFLALAASVIWRRSRNLLFSLLLTFLLVSIAGLGLAVAGWFNTMGLLLGVVLLGLLSWTVHGSVRPDPKLPVWGTCACVGVLVLGLIAARPDHNVAGRWDPGMYLGQGAHLARAGSLLIEDRAGSFLSPDERKTLYHWSTAPNQKFAGFFPREGPEGTVLEPSFSPLYPVWSALLQKAGSLRIAQYADAFWLWCGVLMLFVLARRWMGWQAASLAALLLALNPVQLWFSGFHTGESLMQFLVLGTVLAYQRWQDEEGEGWLAVAGGFVALTVLASVTGWLWLLFFTASHFYLQGMRKRAWIYAVFIIPVMLLWYMYAQWIAPQYMANVFHTVGAFSRILLSPIVWVVVAVSIPGLVVLRRRGLPATVTAMFALLLSFGVLYLLIFPPADDPGIHQYLRLFGPCLLLFVIPGVSFLAQRHPRTVLPWLLPLAVATVVFAQHPMMSLNYPWTYKRILPLCLPFGALAIAVSWARMLSSRKKWIQAVGLLVLLGLTAYPVWQAKSWAFHRDWRNLDRYVAEIATSIPPGALVFAGSYMGTPLELIHDKEVLPLHFDKGFAAGGLYETLIRRAHRNNQEVYFVWRRFIRKELPFDTQRTSAHKRRFSVLHQRPMPYTSAPRSIRCEWWVEQILPHAAP